MLVVCRISFFLVTVASVSRIMNDEGRLLSDESTLSPPLGEDASADSASKILRQEDRSIGATGFVEDMGRTVSEGARLVQEATSFVQRLIRNIPGVVSEVARDIQILKKLLKKTSYGKKVLYFFPKKLGWWGSKFEYGGSGGRRNLGLNYFATR